MNMKRRVGAVLVLGALGTAACGGEPAESTPDGTTVRDSAGVTIVENRTPTRPDSAMWRLAADPELEIGTLEASDEALINVSAARTLSDGRIVVYDNGDSRLRYFSAEGNFIRTSGREGEGPGEFNLGISVDVLEGDTVVVDDIRLRRLSYFDAEGDFVRTVTPQPDGAPVGAYLSSGADGTFYHLSGTNPMYLGEGNGLIRGAGVIAHLDGEGRSLRTVLEFRTSEGIVANNAQARAEVGRDHFALAHPDGFVLGFADDFHYEVYDFEGNLRRVVRRAGDPAPVTEAERDEILESWRASSSEIRRQSVRYLEFPETHPAYEELLVDLEGRVWMQLRRPDDVEGPHRWSVFDRDGRWLSDILIPEDLAVYDIMEIGDDYVLAIGRDDFDVQYLRRYAIVR